MALCDAFATADFFFALPVAHFAACAERVRVSPMTASTRSTAVSVAVASLQFSLSGCASSLRYFSVSWRPIVRAALALVRPLGALFFSRILDGFSRMSIKLSLP